MENARLSQILWVCGAVVDKQVADRIVVLVDFRKGTRGTPNIYIHVKKNLNEHTDSFSIYLLLSQTYCTLTSIRHAVSRNSKLRVEKSCFVCHYQISHFGRCPFQSRVLSIGFHTKSNKGIVLQWPRKAHSRLMYLHYCNVWIRYQWRDASVGWQILYKSVYAHAN